MKYLLLAIFILGLSGCFLSGVTEYVTFEAVSKPYRDKYGPPQNETKYESSGYKSVSWWWWSRGFNVDFVWSSNSLNGWKVGSTYTFTPF